MQARSVRRAFAVTASALALISTHAGASYAALAPASAPTAVSPATKALLVKVGMQQSDLEPGYKLMLQVDGEKLESDADNNCNKVFVTDSQRLARREVVVVNPKGEEIPLGGEVTVYKDALVAANAMKEWRASVASCKPGTWIAGDVRSEDVRIDSETNRLNRALPVADNIDTNILLTPRGSKTSFRLLIIGQRKGAIVTTTYIITAKQPNAIDVAALRILATATGKRLAAAVR